MKNEILLLELLRSVVENRNDEVVALGIQILENDPLYSEPSVLLALGLAHAGSVHGDKKAAVEFVLRAMMLSTAVTLRSAGAHALADAGRPDLAHMKLLEFAHEAQHGDWTKQFFLDALKEPKFSGNVPT